MTSSPSPRTESIGIEARESVNAVFDALSTWRDEVAASTERFSELVLTKMTPAARAMGWPEELVEASRKQLAQVSCCRSRGHVAKLIASAPRMPLG